MKCDKLLARTIYVDCIGRTICYYDPYEVNEAIKELRHQKYKLCLAMARWCENEENRLEAIAPIFDSDKECWEYNSDYWFKWCQRWLELAEKFKE